MDDWQWMKANGITDGSNPQNYITREQVSSILKSLSNITLKIKLKSLYNSIVMVKWYHYTKKDDGLIMKKILAGF